MSRKSLKDGSEPLRRPKTYRTRIIQQVDKDTQEVIAEHLESIDRPPNPHDWIQLYKAGAKYLCGRDEVATETRVFMILLLNVQFGNFTGISQAEIATELDVARSSVARAIKKFLDVGMIQRDRVRQTVGYRFNPNIMHMGAPAARQQAMAIWQAKAARSRAKKDADERKADQAVKESAA